MCIHVLLLRSSKMQEALLLWTFVTSVLILSMWSRLNALAVKVLDNHSEMEKVSDDVFSSTLLEYRCLPLVVPDLHWIV